MSASETCDPAFAALLRRHHFESFESGALGEAPDVVVGLWPDHRIAYVNPAWFRFAEENGAASEFARDWTVGRSLMDAVPEVLRPEYEAGYARCLRSGKPWHEDYECSTPDVFRLFHAVTYPIGAGEGLLSVHSLRLERPHEATPAGLDLSRFVDAHGLMKQCAYCRRFAEAAQPSRWWWVADWVREPPWARVSHGLCAPCCDHHFGLLVDG
jgi:hypothetical protein